MLTKVNKRSSWTTKLFENTFISPRHAVNVKTLLQSNDYAVAVKTYEAQLSSESIFAMITTSIVLYFAATLWWNSVVPTQRLKLSKSKRIGGVKSYLDGLKSDSEENNRKFEKWLFADWLRKDPDPKSGAIPFLKKEKWNSGDNPVLAAFASIMFCVVIASVTERIF
jgi:hypothetical protein